MSPQADRIALFTTSFGGIDSLKPVPAQPQIDTFYITDAVAEADRPAAATWTKLIAPLRAYSYLPGRIQARYYKTQIHRLADAQPYRWLAWADASLSFHELDFIVATAERLAQLPAHRRLLLVPHPQRQNVREEHDFVRTHLKKGNQKLARRYTVKEIGKQMAFLAAEKMNIDGKLWASGFWLIENNPAIGRCWDDWWKHILKFGAMDQLPLPPLIERHGLTPEELGVNIYNNRHFRIIGHQGQV